MGLPLVGLSSSADSLEATWAAFSCWKAMFSLTGCFAAAGFADPRKAWTLTMPMTTRSRAVPAAVM
jgi:hypothetical protein